jgi:hypothetical protein
MAQQMVDFDIPKLLESYRIEINKELTKKYPYWIIVIESMQKIFRQLYAVFIKVNIPKKDFGSFANYLLQVFAPWIYSLHNEIRNRMPILNCPEEVGGLYMITAMTFHYDIARSTQYFFA